MNELKQKYDEAIKASAELAKEIKNVIQKKMADTGGKIDEEGSKIMEEMKEKANELMKEFNDFYDEKIRGK